MLCQSCQEVWSAWAVLVFFLFIIIIFFMSQLCDFTVFFKFFTFPLPASALTPCSILPPPLDETISSCAIGDRQDQDQDPPAHQANLRCHSTAAPLPDETSKVFMGVPFQLPIARLYDFSEARVVLSAAGERHGTWRLD